MKNLARADNIVIQNPTFNNKSNVDAPNLPDKMVALVHFGRSGTGLMHSLIDGHPEVSTLPSIYFSQYFDHATWTKIVSAGWDEMIDRFISVYEVLFDATSPVPVSSKGMKLLTRIGEEGMVKLGCGGNEVLRIDKESLEKNWVTY